MSEEEIVVPKQIRIAVRLIQLEAAGLLVGAAVLLVKTLTGHPNNVWRALLDAAFAILGALVLLFCARGIGLLRSGARTPILMLQLLALPVSFDLAFQAGLIGYGVPILVVSLAVLYLLFTPPARVALDRVPD